MQRFLQEQLGGANGELKAALRYMSQSFRIKDPEIKDLFLDIAAEELGHMEMVATTINMLNGHDVDYEKVEAGEIQSHVLFGSQSRTYKRLRIFMDRRLCNSNRRPVC